MTTIIKKDATKEEIQKILEKFKKKSNKKSLRDCLGKPIVDLKGLDAVEYQKKLRNESF